MFPELFKIPYLNFTFNSYGFLLALAFIFGLFITAKLAERDGLDKQKVYDLGLWVLVASLIGSKLLLIITEWEDRYQNNISEIFSFDFFRSAGVFYGGFIGAVIASVIIMRRYKLPWWRTADVFAPGIIIGQAIGRLGCFSAGCCWGKPTTSWLGIRFSEAGHEVTDVPIVVSHLRDSTERIQWSDKLGGPFEALYLHPTQLYEAFSALIIFFILLWMLKRRKFYGQIILAYAILYAVTRFTIEFWRDDPRGEVFGLSTSQFVALMLFVGSTIVYIKKLYSQRLNIAVTQSKNV